MTGTQSRVELDLSHLVGLAPFSFVVDSSGRISWASPSVSERIVNCTGRQVGELLTSADKKPFDLKTLQKHKGKMIPLLFNTLEGTIPLIGVFQESCGQGGAILAKPSLKSGDPFDGLFIDDFPAEDATLSFLSMHDEHDAFLMETLELVGRAETEHDRALQSEQQFRVLFDNAADGVIVGKSVDNCFIKANNRACEMLGYSQDELAGMHISQVIPDDNLQHAIKTIEAQARGEIEAAQEIPIVRKNGEIFFADVTSTPVRFGDENCLLASLRDVTARKMEQDAKQRRMRFMRTLLDSIPGPLFYKSVDGTYRGCNQQFAENILGMEIESIVGKSVFELSEAIPADLARIYHDADQKLIEEAGTQVYDAEVQCASGQRRVFTFYKSVYRNEKNEVDGMIGAMLDITERKEMEAQAVHSKKLEAIGQLAAGIAHEINTPTQYVGDNTRFMKESFEQLSSLIDAYAELKSAASSGTISPQLLEKIAEVESESDAEYILEEMPQAIEQSLEGVERISQIVLAMKEFSHPGAESKSPADINRAAGFCDFGLGADDDFYRLQ